MDPVDPVNRVRELHFKRPNLCALCALPSQNKSANDCFFSYLLCMTHDINCVISMDYFIRSLQVSLCFVCLKYLHKYARKVMDPSNFIGRLKVNLCFSVPRILAVLPDRGF